MTQKERLQQGLYFDASDPEIIQDRMRAQGLINRYNRLLETEQEEAQGILHELLGSIEGCCYFVPPIFVDYGYNLHVGDGAFFNANFTALDAGEIRVGRHAFIGPNVSIYTPQHPLLAEERNTYYERGLPVVIGDDVWVGGSVVILGGVTIGDGAVIGACSVVTRDIPSGVVAVGNPCRVLRPIAEGDRVLGDVR